MFITVVCSSGTSVIIAFDIFYVYIRDSVWCK